MRLFLLLSGLFITAAALAQPVPTYAWRRVLNLYNYNDTAGNFVTDLSGNGIFQYAENGGSHINHTVKMSPANNLIFDAQTTFGDTYRATGIAISPLVSGKQYAWGTGVINGHGFGGNNPAYYVCYDITNASTAAVPVVQGTYPASPYGDYNVVGVYVNSLGNLMMVINDVDATSHHFMRMITVDRTNSVTSDHTNTAIDPQKAYWNPATNTWIANGYDTAGAYPYSGRWGSYDPATGTETFADSIAGANIPGFETIYGSFAVNPLPGNAIGISRNTEDIQFIPIFSVTYFHTIQVRNPNGSVAWNWPTSGSEGGLGLYTASYSAASPIYSVCNPDLQNAGNQYIDKFNWSGILLWHHTHQPVQMIFPTREGFFGEEYYQPSQGIFLEHYIDASNTYDFGRSYKGTAAGAPIIGGFTFFQNSFFVANSVPNTTTGYDVVMERFVTGIALSSVTCASTVTQNTQLAVTIHLNGNVVGSPMTVALNSSSTKLLLPNGTRGQNFSIPVGQNQLLVMLNAQPVSSNTGVLLTAIQNGVRRTAVTTVQP